MKVEWEPCKVLAYMYRLAHLDRIVQSSIKLTQDKREFWFDFVTLRSGFLYIVWPSVLSCNKLKLQKQKQWKTFVYKKSLCFC